MSAFGFTNDIGQVKIDLGAPVPNAFRGGMAFSATGRLYVATAISVNDKFSAGFRISSLGQLVVVSPGTGPFTSVQGYPADRLDGSIVAVIDGVPAASDAYVGGVRVAPTGVHMTTL